MNILKPKAVFFALLSILFWSTMGSAFKLTLQYTNPPMLLLISCVTSLLFLFVFNYYSTPKFSFRNIQTKYWFKSAIMGLFNPLLYYLVLFEAYSRIPAQEGVALNYIWPLVLVVFSVIFLKQKVSILSMIAILISFLGTLIIVSHGNIYEFSFSDPIGVVLALGSAFFWATFWIINMKDDRAAVPKMLLNFIFGTVYIVLYLAITQKFISIGWQGILGGVYIGIFEMGLTFVLWLMALQSAKNTSMISNLVFISPFLSLFLVSIFVGEKILISTWIGLAVIVTGILMQQFLNFKKITSLNDSKKVENQI